MHILTLLLTVGTRHIQWLIGNGSVATGYFPWQDWNRWETYVTNYVNGYISDPEQLEWVVWQEPDSVEPAVWQGTPEQFFETWKRAVIIIRRLRPNDLIVGPSTVSFNLPYLHSFLIYSQANGVIPDVLSWHELSDIGSSGYTPDLIPQHVLSIKQFLQTNNINISRFHITEYQGTIDKYRPGPTVAFIANIEAARIEGTKGNWGTDGDPRSACRHHSILYYQRFGWV